MPQSADLIRTPSTTASTISTAPTCTAGAITRRCSGARIEGTGATRWCWRQNSARCRPRGRANGVNGRPDYVQAACEASLQAARRRYHRPLLPASRRSERADRGHGRRMARLVEQGKVRYLGLCEARPKPSAARMRVHPLAAVQTEYSLLYRSEAEETLATTRELGIAFVAYSPLGRGFLTGSIHSPADIAGDRAAASAASRRQFRAQPRTWSPDRGDRARKGCTPAQLTLAWLLAQGDDMVPIPGTKQRAASKRISAPWRRAFAGGTLADLGVRSAGRGGGRALSGRRHEGGLQVTNAPVPMGRVALNVSRSTA